MEIFGARFDEEYESFSTNMFDNPNLFVHESLISTFPLDNIFSNIDYFSPHFQESCNNTGIDTSALLAIGDSRPSVNSFHDHLCIDNTFEPMSFYDGLILPDNAMEDTLNLKAERLCTDQNVGSEKDIHLKRKYEEEPAENKSEDGCPKKKSRISKNMQKDQRGVQKSKGKKKVIENKNNTINEEGISNISIGNNTQSLSSGCSSDQDHDRISNGSQKVINGEGSTYVNPDGKAARASRGSATDPQSLYARRRRERISERLRVLQNLVPNGTKVDISTMLEEAVHYVKFLQLQIKLLSSDKMWMYAPIANNGMDLGMFHKISTNM